MELGLGERFVCHHPTRKEKPGHLRFGFPALALANVSTHKVVMQDQSKSRGQDDFYVSKDHTVCYPSFLART